MIALEPEEIQVITGKVRHSAQCEQLAQMGYVFEPRLCDGFPIVSREYFNRRFGVKSERVIKKETPVKGNRQALENLIGAS